MVPERVATTGKMIAVPGVEGWTFASEGAAVFLPEKTAVIADLHLGYEWSRGAGGDAIPAHSLIETVARLDCLLRRVEIARLVVAGDLVESSGPCPRTARDVRRLAAWLAERKVNLTWLRGNHDPPRRPALPGSCEVGGWTISHGDRAIGAGRAIFGHHHPVLRAGGLSAPCFLVGPETIALPAFSPNAAGLDVLSMRLPEALRREPMQCVASLGSETLNFGPLADLRP